MGSYQKRLSNKEKFDAVVVLGKNIGIEWDRNRIARSPFKLSTHSRISTLAAGILFGNGYAKHIIFSGGKTAGQHIPSEALLMKRFLRSRYSYSQVPSRSIILEEKSFSTTTNARYVKEIVRKNKFRNIALLTVGFHARRAELRFRQQGMEVTVLHAEQILFENSKLHRGYISRYLKSVEVRKERLKEFIIRTVAFFDTRDVMFGSILQFTRVRS